MHLSLTVNPESFSHRLEFNPRNHWPCAERYKRSMEGEGPNDSGSCFGQNATETAKEACPALTSSGAADAEWSCQLSRIINCYQ